MHRPKQNPGPGQGSINAISRRTSLLFLGSSLAALATRDAAAQGADTITLGGSVALTGRYAETGTNLSVGYDIAVKFLNEELGGVDIGGKKYKFALQLFDDASDPARATSLVQKQVDDGLKFLLGSYGSNIVLPTASIAEAAGAIMVQIGGASDQIYLQGRKNVFGLFPRATRLWASTVEFFKLLQPAPKTISIIGTNDPFSKTNTDGAIAAFKQGGFEILESYQLPAQISDVSSVMTSVRSKTPDIIVCTTTDQNSLFIAQQMVATSTNVSLLYQILGPQLDVYRKTLGKAADGVCVQQYWDERIPLKDKFFGTSQRFIEYYAKNTTRPATYHTVGAAACILTYVNAMQQAKGLAPAAVRDALAATDLETIYGPVKFTADGDGDPVLMGPKIGQVKNGVVEMVFPSALKTADATYPAPKWAEKR
jgi:branched-chain amino acid transport system substrate-binding protein